MPAMPRPSLSPRTVPVKVTMAPMSVRPAARRRTSAPTSKSSRCTRALKGSTSGHRRKEGDLARPGEAGGRLDVRLIDGGSDDLRPRKCLGVLGPGLPEPRPQVRHRVDAGRQIEVLLGLAGLLAHPGEIADLDGHRAGYCSMAVRMAAFR